MAAAYGQIDPWLEDPVPPPGHLMTFRHSLHSVLDSTSLGIKIVLPKWMFGSERARQEMELAGMAGSGWLGARVRETAIAYSELGVGLTLTESSGFLTDGMHLFLPQKYMHSMILEQRTAGNRPKSTKRDLFSQLVDASSEDADGGKLSMDELFGSEHSSQCTDFGVAWSTCSTQFFCLQICMSLCLPVTRCEETIRRKRVPLH